MNESTPVDTPPRLWRDGHGIERLPLTIQILNGKGGYEDLPVVVVRRDDLVALEDVCYNLRDVAALCCPEGIHWDDPKERAEFFAKAEEVWKQSSGILRGDEEMFEDDDETRPV